MWLGLNLENIIVISLILLHVGLWNLKISFQKDEIFFNAKRTYFVHIFIYILSDQRTKPFDSRNIGKAVALVSLMLGSDRLIKSAAVSRILP